MRLPSGLARRFGPALLADLDRAWGECPDPRVAIALPPRFDSRLELFARADSAEQVLHAAGMLERPSGGDVWIDGQSGWDLSDGERTNIRRNRIGFVYQFHHLLPEFDAISNVALPALITGRTLRADLERGLAAA